MSERSIIAAAIVAGLTGADATIAPYVQTDPNLAFDPPSDRTWAQIYFLDGAERFETIGGAGGSIARGPLLAYVNLYAPIGSGDGTVAELEIATKNALRRLIAGNARWERFDAGPEGRVDGEWRKQIVAVFLRSVRV